MHRALLFLYAETPVHAGADSSLGALDLPIQREVTTGFPIIKAESLKGALRERFRPPPGQRAERERWVKVFGAEPPSAGARAGRLEPGTLRVHEAQLVAFPAPTLTRTFAWVTSPLAAARLERKARIAGLAATRWAAPAADPDGAACLAAGDQRGQSVLGPYLVSVSHDPEVRRWAGQLADAALPDLGEMAYFRDKLRTDLVACSDELLGAISRDCAPIATRIQLGTGEENGAPRKTVQHGPFQSEYLPAESLLAALLECEDSAHLRYVREKLDGEILRLGGDETLGKGLLWCSISSQDDENEDQDSERAVASVEAE